MYIGSLNNKVFCHTASVWPDGDSIKVSLFVS